MLISAERKALQLIFTFFSLDLFCQEGDNNISLVLLKTGKAAPPWEFEVPNEVLLF
jgi:hypothetical protein